MATAGPISGFIVQPIVGVVSDSYTGRLGRRRPFILFGTIFCAVGMALIGLCVKLGALLGDNVNGEDPHDHTWAILLAMLGLALMNLMVNVMQGPARTLVNDVVPEEKLQLGNAMVSTVMGLANIIANIIGALFITVKDPYFFLFILGVEFVIFSLIPTMFSVNEKQYRRPAGVPRQSIGGVFKKIIIGFKSMNRPIFKIVALYFFSWAAYAPMMVSLTTFFQNNLFKDDETEGLKMGLYASACFAAASFLYSLVLPLIIKGVGVKVAYLSSQVIATGCYVSLFFLDSFPAEHRLVIAIVLASLVSFNYTSFNSIPFALMSDLVASEDAGLFMGVLNSASVVAQTASVYIAAGLIAAFDQNLAYGISWGAVPSVAACICVFFLETKKQNAMEGTPLLDPEGSVNTDF